ncbi:hypothetical protein [Streptomyces sp. NBC_00328]|uniref:hypothetical protein n=1 Tax=Streptomyces sp. NBC_00328 TaxID=2903646 RepID=UPI002E2C9CA3|nr:hypothetical protein [Streptomyces sp. NBC_00328]
MEIYAYWLDGEHLRLSEWGPQDLSLSVMLKIQALLGHTVVLSDVQLIDSPVVQTLFETDDFRSFVRGCPEFLRCTTAAPSGSDPFTLVTTGLQRALEPGWLSSSFDTAEPLVRLSEAVLERGDANPGPLFARGTALGALYQESSPLRQRLQAVAWTLHHFSREPGVPLGTSTMARPSSYCDVLEEVAELPGLPGHDYAPVERTLAYLEGHLGEWDRHRRALLMAHLDATNPPHRTAIWNTATQAWNAAVQRTLGTDGASPRSLPEAADVGLYLGSPTDALFEPSDPASTSPAGPGLASNHLAAVGALSWQDMGKIQRDDAVTRRRNEYQTALRAADAAAADDALATLLRAVRKKLPASAHGSGHLGWAAVEAGLAGAGLAIGAADTFGFAAPALAFGLAAERLIRGGRNRSHIVNTLMKAGRRGSWTQRGTT